MTFDEIAQATYWGILAFIFLRFTYKFWIKKDT